MIRKVEMERFTLISSKPFDEVVAALKAAIGHPNMAELWQATQRATTAGELEAAIQPVLGETGLMQFVEFDHGMIVRKGTEHHTSKIIRLVIGNPLIMKEMAKGVPDAGSYAPVTVLVDERADGVHISYDRMASLLAPYGDRDALCIARDLDAKVRRCPETSCSMRRSRRDVLEVVMDGHLVPATSNSKIRCSLENFTLDAERCLAVLDVLDVLDEW